MNLSIQQINHLIAGNRLAAELCASSAEQRRFIDVCGYTYNEQGRRQQLSRIIAQEKRAAALFQVRNYEIAAAYIENGWDVTEDDCVNFSNIDGIIGIESLEQELTKHLSDFSLLVPEWKTDSPL